MPEDVYWCPSCGKLNATFHARLIFFGILLAIIVGAFVTSRYVSYLKRFEASLAQRWSGRGEQAMQAQQYAAAIEDYRNALSYEGSNNQYRLLLAEALTANGNLPEARAYLLSLWSQMPADGEVNLQLARIYAREGEPESAVRYYRTATDGVWSSEAVDHRTDARFELVQYFLERHDRARAAAELIALQAEAPDDPAIQMKTGRLLLELGDSRRAGKAFDAVVKLNPRDADAWTGVGEAALATGDYRTAVKSLTTATSLTSSKPGSPAQDRLELAREVYGADPGLRNLPLNERANRVAANFQAVMTWLEGCAAKQDIPLTPYAPVATEESPQKPGASSQAKSHSFPENVLPTLKRVPESLHSLYERGVHGASAKPAEPPPPTEQDSIAAPNSLQLLYQSGLQRRPRASAEALRHDPDSMMPTMEFVYQAARALETSCPPTTLRSRALVLLASQENEELR